MTVALSMRGIRKTFPGVVALDDVDLEVRRGEVHVLLGENGAGKSTLMKVLSGAVMRDAGTIELDGVPATIASPRDAHQLGIRTIYQELTLIPDLAAAENIFLGREPRRWPGVIDRRALHEGAARVLESLGVAIDMRRPVRRLGIAHQQMVEVARALDASTRVLIMDEPTSALTAQEIAHLFAAIRRLTAAGTAVIYISHRLDEVERIGQRVTVMRDGRRVATHDVGAVSLTDLIRLMADRDLGDHYPKRTVTRGEPLLRVEGISRRGVLHDVGLTVHRGEVVGLAGLLGAGRTEFARAIVGADPRDGGRVEVHGRIIDAHRPVEAMRRGVGFLPEDRKTQGLVQHLSVNDNVTLPSLRTLARRGVVREAAERTVTEQMVRELRIKTPGIHSPVSKLSGGTQQKIVLAKWLAARADVLIMDEPTRGIDVGARIEIYELMNQLTARGAGILMISSELPEVLGMSDRIVVMRLGRIVAEFPAAEATQARVLAAALGHVA